MSNALAIAAVTEALVNLLSDNLGASRVENAHVTNVTPDQPTGLPAAGINVFLYQVSPNNALRNADLSTRSADGTTFLRKPQAALDLHYLLTFYGDDGLLEQQRLLGAATLALHANPALQRAKIRPVEIHHGVFAESGLESQSQLIRFFPVAFTLEELSKLWSFLFKIDYVLSTAYLASVVLIEQDEPTPTPALPVLSVSVTAQSIRQPVISQVVASPDPAAAIVAGGDVALIGRNLNAPSGGSTQVIIGGVMQAPGLITANRITLPLPPGLAAGAQTAQVTQSMLHGIPPVPHPGTGATSAIAAFVLHPAIAPSSPPGDFAISLGSTGSPPGPALVVGVQPTVRAGQRAVLHLLPQANPTASRLFDGGATGTDSDTLVIAIPGLPAGAYFVRILIDGAESPLVLGTGGAPTAPIFTI